MANIELPRLQRYAAIVDEHGQPSLAFHIWWDRISKMLEMQLNTINSQLNTLIQSAQDDATAAAREAARLNSYTTPTVVLSSADTGSATSITIANHTRVYPVQGSIDVPDVSITGATLTGKAYSTTYYIYYDDTTLTNTAPTFVATTTASTAQVGAAAGRHFVGVVTTPAAGGGSTSGDGGLPPGGNGGRNVP